MLETKFVKKLLVLGLALAVGGLVAAGCVDNSGNKTYPRADAGEADAGEDVSVSDDSGTGTDTSAMDAPASDKPASDGSASDTGTADTSLPVDAGVDVRLDAGTGG